MKHLNINYDKGEKKEIIITILSLIILRVVHCLLKIFIIIIITNFHIFFFQFIYFILFYFFLFCFVLLYCLYGFL